MSYTRRIIMAQQGETDDMTEVYAYAQSVGITPQQVDAALANKPSIIKEKLIAWKYLLHSLVDTGYTPWLQGDGVAYIDTGMTLNSSPITIRCKSIGVDYTNENDIVGSYHITGNCAFVLGNSVDGYFVYTNRNSKRKDVNIVDTHTTTGTACDVEVILDMTNGVKTMNVNGYETTGSMTYDSSIPYPTTHIFNGTTKAHPFKGYISYIEIVSGNTNAKFVPYCDNGSCGMLDLVIGTFYGSAVPNGLFSYVLEDANGNQVNIQ